MFSLPNCRTAPCVGHSRATLGFSPTGTRPQSAYRSSISRAKASDSTMSVREWKFKPAGLETELHAVSVTCDAPKAVLVLNHGINEHVGRYESCTLLGMLLGGACRRLCSSRKCAQVGSACPLPTGYCLSQRTTQDTRTSFMPSFRSRCQTAAFFGLNAVDILCKPVPALSTSAALKRPHAAVFQAMCKKSIDCHSFDMRTFGKSQPDRRHMAKIDRFTDLVDDLLAFCSKVKGVRLASPLVAPDA